MGTAQDARYCSEYRGGLSLGSETSEALDRFSPGRGGLSFKHFYSRCRATITSNLLQLPTHTSVKSTRFKETALVGEISRVCEDLANFIKREISSIRSLSNT